MSAGPGRSPSGPAGPADPPDGVPTHAEVRAARALARIAAGEPGAASGALDGIDPEIDPFAAGLVLAALGREGEAFAAFERVREWGSPATEIARYYATDALGPLRSDARWPGLVAAIDAAWGQAPD